MDRRRARFRLRREFHGLRRGRPAPSNVDQGEDGDGQDDEAADDDLRQYFMSLVGAMAWLILTMPAICVYVAFLVALQVVLRPEAVAWAAG